MKIGLEEHKLLLFVVHLSATRWIELISICHFWIAAQLVDEDLMTQIKILLIYGIGIIFCATNQYVSIETIRFIFCSNIIWDDFVPSKIFPPIHWPNSYISPSTL